MSREKHFRPELFEFLREPFLDFISDFGPYLRKISEHYVADPRKVGGSLFRIYRDTRFSKDKSPYKIHAGAQFRHVMGKDVHAPGFYLHMEPNNVFVGVGIWRPDSTSLAKIRDAIVSHPVRWKAAIREKKFASTYVLAGESLKRPPRGYDPRHPLIEDLKRKDFTALHRLTKEDACAAGFIGKFARVCKAASPFMDFLTATLDLPW